MSLREYTDNLLAQGKCYFTTHQAIKELAKSRNAIISAAARLIHLGKIASPAKGFYVILPPEYRALGCLPPEHFVPYLMEYWTSPYYVGLLTAARYHGATHQAVQTFQVMVEKKHRAITCGKVTVQFIVNSALKNTPTQMIATPKSMLTISTPEGTAMDLMKYPKQSGGLNHIVTILTELQESMSPVRLKELILHQPELAWQQRLGYLLEKLGAKELSLVLKENLARQKRVDFISLMSSLPSSAPHPKNDIWKIIENTDFESDV